MALREQTERLLSQEDVTADNVEEMYGVKGINLPDITARDVAEVALDMTPIVGDIKAATELPEDIQLIKDLISEGYDEGDIKKMGLGGLFGIATGLGFIPLLGAPADAARIGIKAGVKKARPPKDKPPVPEFRQKQIDEVKKKYTTSAERRKALKAINRPTPKVFHGASGLGDELNTNQIKGLARDIAFQKRIHTQDPLERMFDGDYALPVDDFVKAIDQPDPDYMPFSVVMADKVSVGSIQPFAVQPKVFRVDPDDGTDGPRFVYMKLKHRDPFDDTPLGESHFAVPIVDGKVIKADVEFMTNRHTEDAYNDIVGTITGDSRAAKLQKEGFAPYKDFTGAKGLTSQSATGEHFELQEQALSTSRDPLVSMKPGFGNRTLQNVVEADLPPEAVADMSRKQYSDIEGTGKLTETMGLDDTTIGASLPKTIHTESEIAVTRPELLDVRRLAEGKPELIRDVEPLTTKKDIPVAKNEKSRTVESTMASRPFQQGPMPESLGQKNVTERVARGQRLVNSIQKRITDLDTSAVDTALKGRPERTINSFYNKTKSLFNELQALGMFTEQYGARGTFDNILEQDILTGDFIGRLGKVARASSKMAEKTGQFGQKEKNLNIMFDTLDALNKNLPKSATKAKRFKEKNSLRGISDSELSSFLFGENPSATTIRKMYKAGLTRSSMFGDVSFGKEVGYDDYKRIIFMMTDKFNEGGLVMAEGGAVPMKEQMELFEDGGMLDEGGTTDPVSGNDVPTGSLQKEVRDDIPAQLSEGEFVMPADVVRYHGLDKMMALRDEAKAGLARMEAMGQMGNSEEATIPEGIPFNIDDLELEDDPIEMQVGGFVQPFTTMPPPPSFSQPYTPPMQSYTPMAPTAIPTSFESYIQPPVGMRPENRVYINPQTGEEMTITFINNQPTIPIPPGFILKSQYTPPPPTPTTTPTATQVTQREDDPSDTPDTSTGGSAAFGGITYDLAYESSGKTAPGFLGALMSKADRVVLTNPAGKTATMSRDLYNSLKKGRNTEFTQQTLNRLFDATEAANTQITQSPGYEKGLFSDNSKELEADAAAAIYKDLGLEYKGQPLSEALILQEDAAVEKERFERAAGVPTTGVETARVTEEEGTTAAEVAKPNMPESFGKDPSTGEELTLVNSAYQVLTGSNDKSARIRAITELATLAGNGYADATESDVSFAKMVYGDMIRNNVATEDEKRIGDSILEYGNLLDSDNRGTTTPARKTKFAEIDDEGVVAEETRLQQEAVRKQQQNREEEDRQTQNYRNKGYSASDAKSAAKNKVAADNAAKKQARDRGESEEHISKTTAVTDSKGNPVKQRDAVTGEIKKNEDGSDKVVTNEPEKEDSSPGKSIVCTEMYRQTQLEDWAKAMKIWDVYQRKYLTPHHEIGYHWLFKPYVIGMQHSGILTQFGAFLARKRTLHLKHVLTKGIAKDDIIGNVWCKIVHPIVYIAGRTKEWLKL